MRPPALNVQTFSLRAVGSATALPSTVTYDPSTHVATLDPDAVLVSGMTYITRITRIRDLAGNQMPSPVTWRFTVA